MKAYKKILSSCCFLLLLTLLLFAGAAGLADRLVPDSISVFAGEEPRAAEALGRLTLGEEAPCGEHASEARGVFRLFGVFPIKEVTVRSYRELSLLPGGYLFGLRAPLGGALVTSLAKEEGARCPAAEAGLLRGDLITEVDGVSITTAAELSKALSASGGRTLSLTVLRGERTLTLSLTPECHSDQEGYRAGLYVKDSVAGIGTVTFVDPESGFFGGLGHGVYDGGSKTPIAITRGAVTEVGLTGVRRGASGSPGELRGHLEADKTGTLLMNTECGVFGVLHTPRSGSEAIPIGLARDVTVGKAEIISTVEEGGPCRYTIEITSLRGEKGSTKSFSIRVVDERLLERTGGIVQGMSGSPIIQNGRLIGAVTHVMIGDPTAGYGIYIENMLDAAGAAGMQKAA